MSCTLVVDRSLEEVHRMTTAVHHCILLADRGEVRCNRLVDWEVEHHIHLAAEEGLRSLHHRHNAAAAADDDEEEVAVRIRLVDQGELRNHHLRRTSIDSTLSFRCDEPENQRCERLRPGVRN